MPKPKLNGYKHRQLIAASQRDAADALACLKQILDARNSTALAMATTRASLAVGRIVTSLAEMQTLAGHRGAVEVSPVPPEDS